MNDSLEDFLHILNRKKTLFFSFLFYRLIKQNIWIFFYIFTSHRLICKTLSYFIQTNKLNCDYQYLFGYAYLIWDSRHIVWLIGSHLIIFCKEPFCIYTKIRDSKKIIKFHPLVKPCFYNDIHVWYKIRIMLTNQWEIILPYLSLVCYSYSEDFLKVNWGEMSSGTKRSYRILTKRS